MIRMVCEEFANGAPMVLRRMDGSTLAQGVATLKFSLSYGDSG